MKNHLSSEQLCKGMLGEWTSAEQQHADECPQCHAEWIELRDTLSLFRGSVREWADAQTRFEAPTTGALMTASRGLRGGRWGWVLATAALLLLIVIPAGNNVTQRQREAAAAAEDAALLNEVHEHLARPVASSMEPFLELLNGEQQ